MADLHLVMFVIEELVIEHEDHKEHIKFPVDGSNWIGVAPVFKTKEAAEAFSGGECQIITVKAVGNEQEYTIEM